jgi:hypothetical protein
MSSIEEVILTYPPAVRVTEEKAEAQVDDPPGLPTDGNAKDP